MAEQRPATEVYVSPETVADDDDPLYKEMAMLQKHIEALTLTHMGLRQQLEGAAACAEEVTRKLAQGKRCNGLAEQSSSTDDGSPFRRKKPMTRGTITQSYRTTDTSVSSSESLPTAYRSCNLDDDDAAGDAAEFDAHVVADEGPELTYRSCEINGSFDTEEEALAAMESAYAAHCYRGVARPADGGDEGLFTVTRPSKADIWRFFWRCIVNDRNKHTCVRALTRISPNRPTTPRHPVCMHAVALGSTLSGGTAA